MLFKFRIGFSGTPNNLLPLELGQCHYEGGSDGKMLHVLTNNDIVSYEDMPRDWNVQSLLIRIATSSSPRFHSLIDTGALITNMSNLQVAKFLIQVCC
jgi:hypothetical protein